MKCISGKKNQFVILLVDIFLLQLLFGRQIEKMWEDSLDFVRKGKNVFIFRDFLLNFSIKRVFFFIVKLLIRE